MGFLKKIEKWSEKHIEGMFHKEASDEMKRKEHDEREESQEHTMTADKGTFYAKNEPEDLHQDTMVLHDLPKIPEACLIIKMGTREISRFPIREQGVIIGRRKTSDLCLPDENISRTHASVNFSGDGHYITDLGSTNGTYLNGKRISKAKLENGDIIKVGMSMLEYRMV